MFGNRDYYDPEPEADPRSHMLLELMYGSQLFAATRPGDSVPPPMSDEQDSQMTERPGLGQGG